MAFPRALELRAFYILGEMKKIRGALARDRSFYRDPEAHVISKKVQPPKTCRFLGAEQFLIKNGLLLNLCRRFLYMGLIPIDCWVPLHGCPFNRVGVSAVRSKTPGAVRTVLIAGALEATI